MEKLTHQEEEIMLVIWKKKRGIIKDFLEQLPEPQPPYTTVASIVKNLEKKGFLSSEKIGNTYLYIPRITQAIFQIPIKRWSHSSPTNKNSRKKICGKSSK